jgi:anti-sigma B factor antagonist
VITQTFASPRLLLETVQGVTVASFADNDLIAEDVIDELGSQFQSLVANVGDAPNVLLSFRDVKFMSSTVLALVLKLSRNVVKQGGTFKVCAIAPNLFEIFQITRFDRLLEIFNTEADALETFHLERASAIKV